MIFITFKVLNLVSLSTQSLASCVNYFWNCLPCFSKHENRFRYKFFDIVQFSRSCAPQPRGWQLIYFITFVISCQALFWKIFEIHFWFCRIFTFERPFWSFASHRMFAWQLCILAQLPAKSKSFFQFFLCFSSFRLFVQFFRSEEHTSELQSQR